MMRARVCGMVALVSIVPFMILVVAHAAAPFGEISYNPISDSLVFGNVTINTLAHEVAAFPSAIDDVRVFVEGIDSMLRTALAPRWDQNVPDNTKCVGFDVNNIPSNLTDVIETCVVPSAYDLNELLPLRFTIGTNSSGTGATSSTELPLGLHLNPDGTVTGALNQSALDDILPGTYHTLPFTVAVTNSLGVPASETRTFVLRVSHEVFYPLPGSTGYSQGRVSIFAISGDGETVITGDPTHNTTEGAAFTMTWESALDGGQAVAVVGNGTALLGQDDTYFGYRVATSSDGCTALVGAPYYNPGYISAGAAVFLSRATTADPWEEVQVVLSDAPVTGGVFGGRSLDLSADGAVGVVGDMYREHNGTDFLGALQVFRSNGTGYYRSQVLLPEPELWLTEDAHFSLVNALSGDGEHLFVGLGNPRMGYLYYASDDTFELQQTFPEECADQLVFNADFTFDGALFVLSRVPCLLEYSEIAVTVYALVDNNAGYVIQQELVPSEAMSGGYFGYGLAFAGDASKILVSAPTTTSSDGSATASGKVCVFDWVENEGAFVETLVIENDVPASSMNLGFALSVSYDGKRAVIGAATNSMLVVQL